jgi:DNA-binding IclR family transcriptional regulator
LSDDAPSGVLAKALAVLQAFTVEDTTLGFAELQRRTDFAKSTLHRVLGDLVAARLLDRVQGRYRLSGLVFELGMRASVERGLLEVATPFLEDPFRTHP